MGSPPEWFHDGRPFSSPRFFSSFILCSTATEYKLGLQEYYRTTTRHRVQLGKRETWSLCLGVPLFSKILDMHARDFSTSLLVNDGLYPTWLYLHKKVLRTKGLWLRFSPPPHRVYRCQFRWRLSLSFGRSYISLPVCFGGRMRAGTSVSQQVSRGTDSGAAGRCALDARSCGKVIPYNITYLPTLAEHLCERPNAKDLGSIC